ncbi:MAG: hypothetical protein P4L36_04050 [Holophaga sp.]|nr:hypothetical protein [Holophaga sp.]
MPSFRQRLLFCLPMLLVLGCGGASGGTALYVYDNATSSVLVWSDVSKVYASAEAGTTVAAADRKIVNGLSSSTELAWGGLTLDNSSNRLYLVTTSGVVYVIKKASSQTGTISKQADIISFNLGQSGTDPYSAGSVFEQASVDGNSNTLFVLEVAADGSATRVWKITNASNVDNDTTFTPASSYTTGVSTDTFGCGVAAMSGGNLFGLFGGGGTIYNGLGTVAYSGPRLRKGSGGTLTAPASGDYSSGAIIGSSTELGSSLEYGALGYDSQNLVLYVFAPSSTAPTDAAILVFNNGQFSPGLDEAPTRTLGDTAGALASLRTISHPATGDWLLGANFTLTSDSKIGAGTGGDTLMIWKAPSGGSAAVTATLPGTSEIRGMTIGN